MLCSLHREVKIQYEHSVTVSKMIELLLSVQVCKFLEKGKLKVSIFPLDEKLQYR